MHAPQRAAPLMCWVVRAGLWAGALGAFVLLLASDIRLMNWRDGWFPEKPDGLLRQLLFGLRDFAQILPIVVTQIGVATYDRRRWRIIAVVLLAQFVACLGYNSGKLALVRYRPHAEIPGLGGSAPASVWETWGGWQPGNRRGETQSFPSGHSAAAFAQAGALGWFYPPLRWLLWLLATGCAVSRFLDGVHWPSDCLAGAAIGYVAARLALRLLRAPSPAAGGTR